MYIFGGTVDNNIRSGEMYRFQVGPDRVGLFWWDCCLSRVWLPGWRA